MTDPLSRLRHFLAELKRRKVYRVGVVYLVAAFVVLQLAELAAGAFALPGWFEPMVWVLCGLGFPIALVLAWAFDLTPEGVKRTSAGDESEGARPSAEPGRRVSRLVAGGLVALGLVAAAAGGWYLMGASSGDPGAEAGPPDRSIAVLPFANLSGTEDAEPYVNGIHDDLVARLSNISGLKVISRTSVMPYRDTDLDVPAIADSLGVAWILEGSVQKLGDGIQVNAQLIDPRLDTHAWVDTYRRDLTAEDVFTLQSEITKRIARSLEARLTSAEEGRVERRPTENLEAYRLYVQGRTHLNRRTEEGMRRGLELFEEAVQRDSTYALAWSGLADARSLLAFYGYAEPDEMYPAAMNAARRSVELAPELAEAHAALGHLHLSPAPTRNLAAALRELERAVELKPSYAQAHLWLAEVEGALGRPDRMLLRARRAVELDPHSQLNQLLLGWTYWWVEGPGERALRHVRRAAALEPGYATAHVDEGLILLHAGRHDDGLTAIRRGLERAPEGSFSRSLALGSLGVAHALERDTARARQMVARLEEEGAPFFEAMVHASLGDEDSAFASFDQVSWGMVQLLDLHSIPFFDVLRDDPRYEDLLRQVHQSMGLDPDGSLPDSMEAKIGS